MSDAVLTLEGVGARGRATPGEATPVLRDVNVCFERGAHALLGSRVDGVSLVLELLAGQRQPTRGRVQVDGHDATTEGARRAIAYVPIVVDLPSLLRVDEWFALSESHRSGTATPATSVRERIRPHGLERLATKRLGELTRPERRAVALVLALTSPSVRAVLVEEPWFEVAAEVGATLGDALGRFAERGIVIVGTCSLRDALRTTTAPIRLAAGVLGAPTLGIGAVEVVVETASAARLGAALSERASSGDHDVDRAVDRVTWERDRLIATGTDLPALARVVRDAIVQTGISIHAFHTIPSEAPLAWPPPPPPASHAERER